MRSSPPPARRPGTRQARRATPLAAAVAVLLAAWAAGPPAWAQAAPAAAEAPVTVRAFQVEGNTLIDPARVQAALSPFVGPRTLAELKQAAQAVQALYTEAGYGAVVAYLPPQPVADGVVTVRVVQGRLARVEVQGARRLSPERVRAALPSLVEGGTPRVRQIDAELQIANENPGRGLGVLLGPGAAPGEVLATVKVQEQPLNRFTLSLDNSGNERTGDYRLGLAWQHADLTGHDDALSLQVQTSPTESSAVKVLSAGYRWPLPRQRLAIDLFAAYSDVDGGLQATAAGDLRFAGRGRIAGARAVWYLPRWGEFDQRLTTGLETRAYLNDCSVSGLPDGACGPSGESVSVHPVTLEYAAQAGGPTPAAVNLSLAHNLSLGGRHGDAADFEAVRAGAPRGYTVLRASGLYSLAVMDDTVLAARLSAQHSGDPLVPGEQFGLGGAYSVRGYAEREIAGDSGLMVSLELTSPPLGSRLGPVGEWLAQGEGDLRLLAFADAGQVRNQGDLGCRGTSTRCSLASVGLGARLSWRQVQLRLFVAQALKDGADTERQDWRTHLALSASF